MLKKVLIANRGEIAVRVIRTCRELGVATVAVYSELDRDALHVRLADEAYALGGQTAAESYLNTEAILDVIERSGADAVHPGYGFFSENTDFARAITERGVTFIGPPPEAIEVMGDKISARHAAERAGVSGVPGRTDVLASPDEVVAFGDEFGWPVAIKAAFGGGGRGMKVVSGPDDGARGAGVGHARVPRLLRSRRMLRGALSGLAAPRRDAGDLRYPRQRAVARRARLLRPATPPEARRGEPGPATSPTTCAVAMGEASVKVARACGYVNAGTVEFLYQDGEFFFLEMNTRLQVEHPVTELVTGLDLVEWQLRVASGEPLGFTQDDVQRNGHAIEVRINAENPAGGAFTPSPGTISRMVAPGGPGVRLDAGYESGDTVSQFYDNLVAKLVVWGHDRESARRRMLRAIDETVIEGVATTLPADVAILSHPDFVAGEHSTNWVEQSLDLSTVAVPVDPEPPAPTDGEESVPRVLRDVTAEVDGRRYQVKLWVPDLGDAVAVSGGTAGQAGSAGGRGTGPKRPKAAAAGGGSGTVAVPMQGTIVKVLVAEGDTVEVGQTVCVLEAMKMENNVNAEKAGTVKEVRVAPGDSVGPGRRDRRHRIAAGRRAPSAARRAPGATPSRRSPHDRHPHTCGRRRRQRHGRRGQAARPR